MSRRKQSNPKPLKRKAEDEELLELAERVCLPRDALCLGEANSNSESEDESSNPPGTPADRDGVSVQAVKKLSEGHQFGPYQAEILDQDDGHGDGDRRLSPDHQILRTKNRNGRMIKISVKEAAGHWLKLIKSASAYHSANFSFYSRGDLVWCRVKRDLEIETELRGAYEGEAKLVPSSETTPTTSPTIPGNKLAKIRRLSVSGESSVNGENVAEKVERERGPESPTNHQSPAHPHPQPSALLVNGDDVKTERLSPGPDSPARTIVAVRQPEFIKVPVSEESSYPETTGLPAFPPYGYNPQVPPGGFVYVPFLSGQQMSPRPSSVSSVSSDQNEPKTIKAGFNCLPCGITFSSLRTLQAHQSYYCAHRTINLKNRNEDGSSNNEDGAGRPKSRNHYSPRTRRTNNPTTEDGSRGGGGVPAAGTLGEESTVSDASNASEMASMSARSNNKSFNKITSEKTYVCNFCDYVTDRKGGLTRHVRTHSETLTAPSSPDRSASPGTSTSKDNPSERYCANCEIQFASRKTYHVHKALYCGTRHVHKSTTPVPRPVSPALPGTSSQPNIYEDRLITTPRVINANRRRDNKSGLPVVLPRPISPNSSSLPSTGVDPKTGLVFGHPFYAAISTSPLILVPCSYLPGRGITPTAGAGGIVLPNGSASDDVLSLSPVPAFAVLPNPNATRNEAGAALGLGTTPKARPITPKSETDVKVGESSFVSGDKPLDLSLRKKDEDSSAGGSGSGNRERSTPSSHHLNEPKVAVVLPSNQASFGMPPLPVTVNTRHLEHSNPPGVLVKQGTSRCKECNIVFYKHENYLVHKRMYCASRQSRNKRSSTSSPENDRLSNASPKNGGGSNKGGESNSPARSAESSPGHSPNSLTNVKCPSPGTNSSPRLTVTGVNANAATSVVGPHAIYQLFYCFACHIKFTSLDNLRAHQTYYCPKRQIAVPEPSNSRSPRGPETGLRCPKCKHRFPTEETLRCHPCGSQRKCPYCEVNCPTLSAAQRHLVTHTGVKAFRCTICGYKGHTLRGMRTHIRIHLESGCSTPEENYIVCVGEDGVTVAKSDSASPKDAAAATDKSDIGAEANPTGKSPSNLDESLVDNSSQGAVAPDVQHWCQFCGYTSSYKGNVVRHIKLVHRDIVLTPTNPGIVGVAPVAGQPIQPAPTLMGESSSGVGVSELPVSLVVKKETDSEHSNDSRLSDNTDKMEVEGEGSRDSSPGETSTINRGVKKEASNSSSSSNSSAANEQNTGGVSGKKIGSKYCKTCDISFKHLSNFIAHKKFYCSPQNNDPTNAVTTATTTTTTANTITSV